MTFMEEHVVEWCSIMLSTEVFQSYSSIVSPNEAVTYRKMADEPDFELSADTRDYYALKRK